MPSTPSPKLKSCTFAMHDYLSVPSVVVSFHAKLWWFSTLKRSLTQRACQSLMYVVMVVKHNHQPNSSRASTLWPAFRVQVEPRQLHRPVIDTICFAQPCIMPRNSAPNAREPECDNVARYFPAASFTHLLHLTQSGQTHEVVATSRRTNLHRGFVLAGLSEFESPRVCSPALHLLCRLNVARPEARLSSNICFRFARWRL